MNNKEVENFEQIQLRLEGMYNEIKALSGKRPDDAINLFKLKLVNQTIQEANKILHERDLPFEGFTKFDENELPTNSDIAFVLSGYLSGFEKMRSDNIRMSLGYWYWVVNNEISNIRTAAPKKLTK